MEKCKYCEAELEQGSTVCPKCGKDNAAETPAEAPAVVPAEVAAAAPAETPAAAPVAEVPAEPAKAKLSAGKTVLAIVAVVVVGILLAAVLLNGQKAPVEEPAAETEAVTEAATEAAPVETQAPTVPADGNPDDVTCKGTYTAEDEEILAVKDLVVATAGDRELTMSQLQAFYWMQVRNFLTQYGAYAAYFGLDLQQPLDTQMCGVMDTPMTWQQYFLEAALNAWRNYSAMSEESKIAGFELPAAQTAALENVEQDLAAAAEANGFASAEEMLHSSLGNVAGVEDYRYFMEQYYRANGYFNFLSSQIDPTDEELEAYFDEHADGYTQSGITKETKSVDVRHILIYPEGADGTNIFTEEFPEEAWTAGEAAANALLAQWQEGDATEESFAALANEHSQDPGSNKNGGLYQGVIEGEMVQAFNDWCFDASRQVGDTGVVRTEYGFHVMFFSGSQLMWRDYAKTDYVGEAANNQASAIGDRDPMTVKYDAILISKVDMGL